MGADRISVVVIGHPDPDIAEHLRVEGIAPEMADGFDVTTLASDADIRSVLAARRPHVILTFGEVGDHEHLAAEPIEIRRRWIHHDEVPSDAILANAVLDAFVDVATNDRFPEVPVVSVFTPTFRTGARIERTYASLVAQTHRNWEWVVFDDSPDDPSDDTWDRLRAIAGGDHRVSLYRSDRHSGVIGEMKRRCCGLARGSILVELDHDDELLPSCLDDLVRAFTAHPEAGFAYTDCAEIFESGGNASYGETFAFGFGSYRIERHRDHDYFVTNQPDLNAKTIRHIVGVPNHVRAWRREAYFAAGGHSPEIHVADDYELLVRTFLTTRFVHVRRFGYIQYLGDGGENAHRRRNAEIQRAVALFASRYESEIRARLDELGSVDFIRDGAVNDWSREAPDDLVPANLSWP